MLSGVKLNVSFRIVLLRVIMKNDILQSIAAGAFLCTVKIALIQLIYSSTPWYSSLTSLPAKVTSNGKY